MNTPGGTKKAGSISGKSSQKMAIGIAAAAAVGGAIFFFSNAQKQPSPPTTSSGKPTDSPAANLAKRMRDSKEAIHNAAVESLKGTKQFERDGFSVQYPASWQTSDEKIADAQIFRAHTLDGFANMAVTTHKIDEKDFEWWSQTVTKSLKQVMGPNTNVASIKPIKVRGASRATQIVYETQLENTPVRAKQSMVLAARKDRGYTVACSAPAIYYGEFQKVFQNIESSIQVRDTPEQSGKSQQMPAAVPKQAR